MENALIPLLTAEVEAETLPICNARDLHAALQVGRVFGTWITDRIEQYGFVEGEDYFPVSGNRSDGKPGKKRTDYHLSIDMAKELAMIENNEIGRAVRRYFIQAEKTLREKLQAELREKAAHVLPVRGVKLMRDGLSMRDTLKLQEHSRKLLRLLVTAETAAERKNLYLHFRQINLTLGVPTLDLAEIETELSCGQPAKGV
ncbi:antA/AntB antirepressor family protein [Azonexus hydrophilus]|uniref:AntA/AntB antirepressor family protein n=1 Tax=Azonexus hydrophilus TaxID=418702 RepID=A0ABZ2XDR3_9RHOO